LCFDNMKNMNNEPKKLMKPGTETEAVAAGQRRIGKRVQAGGSGQAIGKRIGLAHIAPASTRLGPDNSTQVVDFPHLAHVSLFWERAKIVLATDGTRIKHRLGKETEQMGTEIGRKRTQRTQKMENSADQTRASSGCIHISVAIFVTERSLMFAYVRLKSLMFAYFEKKYFFPALWLLSTGAQWVGAMTVEGWKKNVLSPVARYAGATPTGRVRELFLLDEPAWAMYLEAVEIELNKKFGMA